MVRMVEFGLVIEVFFWEEDSDIGQEERDSMASDVRECLAEAGSGSSCRHGVDLLYYKMLSKPFGDTTQVAAM